MPPQTPWDEAVQRVQSQAPASESSQNLADVLANYGAIETLGGIGGGLLGGVPGALAGASLGRFLRGVRQGEAPGSSALSAMGQGALEAVGPGTSSLIRRGGTALVRSTLPKATEVFAGAAHGDPFKGRRVLAEHITTAPGLTPAGTFTRAQRGIQRSEREITRGLRAAQRQGVTLDVERMTRPARQAAQKRVASNLAQPGGARAAQRLITGFEQQPSDMLLGRQVMTPIQVRRLQKSTRFSPFEQGVTKPQVVSALRQGMSRELKKQVPAVRAPLAREAQLIPIRDLLATMVPGPEVVGGRIGLHGVGAGIPLNLLREATFTAGKGLARTRPAARVLPAGVRFALGHEGR